MNMSFRLCVKQEYAEACFGKELQMRQKVQVSSLRSQLE